MGKRGRAEDKGKEEEDELIGKIKGVAISTYRDHFCCLIENRLLSICLCSTESTFVVLCSFEIYLTGFLSLLMLGYINPLYSQQSKDNEQGVFYCSHLKFKTDTPLKEIGGRMHSCLTGAPKNQLTVGKKM